jgi:hypothetical protein
MEWSRSDLGSLALASCTSCGGSGARREKNGQPVPCGCVWRAAFRACHARFRDCVTRGKYRSRISFERSPSGRSNRGMWCRPEEEYMADFELVSRRHLDEWHYRVFRFHFLLGADWRLCCPRLGMDRGNFYHAVYRIEERLGKVFSELEPYALFPPRDYFVLRLPGPVQSCLAPAASLRARL